MQQQVLIDALNAAGTRVKVVVVPSGGSKVATKILDKATIAASDTTALVDCATIDLSSGATTLALTVEATYDAAATQGVKVHLRSSYDGSHWDTVDYDTFTASFSAGGTIRQTKAYTVSPAYIKVLIENLDGTHTVTAVKVYSTVG